jgi:hypothetical protein
MKNKNNNQEIDFVWRHLRWGWWALLGYLTVGMALETMHGFKLGWYLNTDNETRRLMFTLGHAHGVLLGILNLGFAFTQKVFGKQGASTPRLASQTLIAATILLPLGFLLGGIKVYGGDPGLGILLVPIGAVLLFIAVLSTGLQLKQAC